MKNSLLILFISFLSLGGLLLNPSQPSSKADSTDNYVATIEYQSNYNEDSLQHILDSIGDYKTEEVNKYVTEVKKSTETIKEKQEKLKELEMSTDILLSQMDTISSDTTILDTLKPIKKQSWFKKQINKLKNK